MFHLMREQNTAWARTNDPNKPRISLLYRQPINYKSKLEKVNFDNQHKRRQKIFEQFRKRRSELESNKELTLDQIYEIMRKEYDEWKIKIDEELELEASQQPQLTLDDIIDMEQEIYDETSQFWDENERRFAEELDLEEHQKASEVLVDIDMLYDECNEGYHRPSTPQWPFWSNTIEMINNFVICQTDDWFHLNLVKIPDEFDLAQFCSSIASLCSEHNAEVEDEEDRWNTFKPETSLTSIWTSNDTVVIKCLTCNFTEFCEI